jgi:hypothetical protein
MLPQATFMLSQARTYCVFHQLGVKVGSHCFETYAMQSGKTRQHILGPSHPIEQEPCKGRPSERGSQGGVSEEVLAYFQTQRHFCKT